MPLVGEYQPSPEKWVRDQVDPRVELRDGPVRRDMTSWSRCPAVTDREF
ncbi:hypothetical protein [Streptomyces orinoci]|uniref:Uncharacterized protein n=1 Tax=Streptomyces orinoci TaxID=67339 RepID=A0ABV3K5G0_STRON|nr:hypothetical protein [Streptomyces orinoci]